jgi:hypothetical protein
MRKWFLTALALGACTLSNASAIPPGQLNSEIEQIGAAILAEKMGIPIDQILGDSRRYDESVYDMAPMYSIRRETHRSTDEIWRLREQGMGWGNIAKRLGMHPGTFNKMRVRGEFDNDWRWDEELHNRYGWSTTEISKRRKSGARWGTLFMEAERKRKGGKSSSKGTLHKSTDNHRGGNTKTKVEHGKGHSKTEVQHGKGHMKTSGGGSGKVKTKGGGSTHGGGSGKGGGNGKGGGKGKG